MSGVVGWYGFKSGKPVERDHARSGTLCWKCRDGRTRAHNRLCRKRGGKVERFRFAWLAEAVAAMRREPSPGRLRGLMLSQAHALGEQAGKHSAEAEKILREMSPLTASPERLKELAALYGVA